MREIYFDNSATTKVAPFAAQAALKAMEEDYGNPSSLHGKGVAASEIIRKAKEILSPLLQGGEGDIYFTSGGSESNNTAIFGVAAAHGKRAKRILVSPMEHPSVLEPVEDLKNRGFIMENIPLDKEGLILLPAFEEMLGEDILLISIQHVNNETGAVQPLEEIGALIREKAPRAFFHIDGVQGFCKLPTRLALWGAHLYSASGHKLHAPKGCGFLWLKKQMRIAPLILGGGQEKNLRSGTENVPGIAAFKAAAEYYGKRQAKSAAHMGQLREFLWQELNKNIDDCFCNSPKGGAPHILNISFLGIKSEVLLHYLEGEGLYVSSGSACHSNKKLSGSPVLRGMGLPKERIDSAIRFSFSPQNTLEEAKAASVIIKKAVAELRLL